MRAAILLTLACAGCAPAQHPAGLWDAVLAMPSQNAGTVEIPFRLELSAGPPRACFFEGDDKVCSTSARLDGNRIEAQFDFLRSELRLEQRGSALEGRWGPAGSTRSLPVRARRFAPPPEPASPPARIDGYWEIRPADNPGNSPWRLIIRQSGAALSGTILRIDGDNGTLTGRIDGKKFAMSHFAGERAILLEGDVNEDGTLSINQTRRVRLLAMRSKDARARGLPEPPDPSRYASIKDPSEPFRFRFPSLEGKQLSDADFRGQVMVLSITGSWCPNCNDEAPTLAAFDREYRSRGLAVVAFSFETADDPGHERLRAFIQRHGASYTFLLPGTPDDARKTFPQIVNFPGFPTTLFVGRDGRVRSVHAGFPGKGSGDEQAKTQREMRELIERLLAEKQ